MNQHRSHWAATFVQTRFDHQALGHGVDGCFKFEHFSLQEHLLEQLVNASTNLGRDFAERRIATELFGHDFFSYQFAFDALRVGTGFVNFVDRHHDRHTGSLGMLDGFFGLRHHAVIRRHHQDDDISGFRAAGTHGREGLVTRGI